MRRRDRPKQLVPGAVGGRIGWRQGNPRQHSPNYHSVMPRLTIIRESVETAQESVGRGYRATTGGAGPSQRLFWTLFWGIFIVLGTILMLAIMIPVVILLVAFGVLGFCWLRVRSLFKRAHEPNGPLDGRRNVRVRTADDAPPE